MTNLFHFLIVFLALFIWVLAFPAIDQKEISISDLASATLVLVTLSAVLEAKRSHVNQIRANSAIASTRRYNEVRERIYFAKSSRELDCAYEQYWSLQFEEWYLYTSGKIDEKLFLEWCLKRVVYIYRNKSHLLPLAHSGGSKILNSAKYYAVKSRYRDFYTYNGLKRMSVHTAFSAFFAGLYMLAITLEAERNVRSGTEENSCGETIEPKFAWLEFLRLIDDTRLQVYLVPFRLKQAFHFGGEVPPKTEVCELRDRGYFWISTGHTRKFKTSRTSRKHINKAAKLLDKVSREWDRIKLMVEQEDYGSSANLSPR